MKDHWKNFSEENRDEFEKESPRDLFFERVAPHLKSEKEPRMVKLSFVWQMAAAFLVLFGITLFFMLNKENTASETKVAEKKSLKNERLVLANLNPEVAEAEYYYVTKIDDLMEEVEARNLTPEIKEILDQLDIEFKQLQKEMGENVNSERIVEALIENYRLKLKLLEKILNSYESNEDENENETPA